MALQGQMDSNSRNHQQEEKMLQKDTKHAGKNEPNAKDKDELDNWNLKINLFLPHNTMNFF